MSTVFIKKYKEIQFNKKEILRYAGIKDNSLNNLIDECISEAKNAFSYSVCYAIFDISFDKDCLDLSFTKTKSNALIKNLKDSSKIIVFGATIGLGIDRLIAKYTKIAPSKALIFQAIGAERIESLCDAFSDEIKIELKKKNLFTRPRFSPGYGDFGLEYQKDIFNVLNCHKNIGLTLNDSLIMSPSKSVTAIIGISDKEICFDKEKCENCVKKDCDFRKN